jgi:Flp pilus assembly protein TadD
MRRVIGIQSARNPRPSAELGPDQARYFYVYAVALQSAGHRGEAMKVLKEALAKHPDNRAVLLALITFSRDAGDLTSAVDYAERLARITPDYRDIASFVQDLRHQIEKSQAK